MITQTVLYSADSFYFYGVVGVVGAKELSVDIEES
jgi:hypothetical protein